MKTNDPKPWIVLEPYRGTFFQGEWPTLPELFNITLERYPDRRCFSIFEPDNLFFTYQEAHLYITQLANYLVKKGIKKGDHIGLTGKNSPEWGVAYLAILFAGGVVVPFDYQLKSEEIEDLMVFANVKILFVDEEKYDDFSTASLLGKMLATKDKGHLREKISLSKNKENYILKYLHEEPISHDLPAENDPAAILFTSGTTGNQKGVILTHRNLVSDCYLAQANMNIFHTDVFYALLPLHHSYTMLAVFIEAISAGAEIVFAKKLVIKEILRDLKKGRVTMFLAIPMLFNKMLKGLLQGIREKGIVVYGIIRGLMMVSGFIKKVTGVNPGKKIFKGILAKLSLDTNRICICGGGPLPSSTFSMFNQLGIDFVQGYGLTETSPILTLNPVEYYKETSVGKVIPQAVIKIADPDERNNGEILVKGPMVMQGYYKNEKATKEVFTEGGWLKTGDVGYLDNENYLYLTGRRKSLIVTEGGKNIFPEEIEDHFQLHEEIEQIMVRGYVKDEKMKTEGIEAIIYPNYELFKTQGNKTDREVPKQIIETKMHSIISEVNRGLPQYKKIEKIFVLDEPMEMTTTKKIKRHTVEI